MIELPDDGWPELVPLLVAEFQKGSDPVKQSTLEALGYICEQIDPSVLEAHSNSILTIVVQGMRKEQPNADVRQAGTRALINALSFVKRNFDNDHERNYIMQTVCETTLREQTVDGRQQIERLETRVGAFECLVAIAELYYDKLGAYMTALFDDVEKVPTNLPSGTTLPDGTFAWTFVRDPLERALSAYAETDAVTRRLDGANEHQHAVSADVRYVDVPASVDNGAARFIAYLDDIVSARRGQSPRPPLRPSSAPWRASGCA